MADASAFPEPRETLDVFLATTAMVKERTSTIIVYNSGIMTLTCKHIRYGRI
jgi:hypothetical protein